MRCPSAVAARRDPAGRIARISVVALDVASYTELLDWEEHLTTVDAEHSAVHAAHLGWAVTVTGPDLILIELRTDDGPSGEDE
jgi:hypothetical protein